MAAVVTVTPPTEAAILSTPGAIATIGVGAITVAAAESTLGVIVTTALVMLSEGAWMVATLPRAVAVNVTLGVGAMTAAAAESTLGATSTPDITVWTDAAAESTVGN